MSGTDDTEANKEKFLVSGDCNIVQRNWKVNKKGLSSETGIWKIPLWACGMAIYVTSHLFSGKVKKKNPTNKQTNKQNTTVLFHKAGYVVTAQFTTFMDNHN